MSNYRRHQMEKDLPDGSPNLCEFLHRHFIEAGMPVPREDIMFISKLVSSYVKTTPHGKATMLTLMNCKPRPASILNTYYRAGNIGQENQRIKATDLMEFKGWIHKGTNTVRWDAIDIDEREDASVCDSCGGRYPVDYCLAQTENIKRTGEARMEMWCNHCRYQSEDPRVRQTGDQKKCDGCEKIICEFNPKHHSLPNSNIALLPTRAVSGEPNLPPGWVMP